MSSVVDKMRWLTTEGRELVDDDAHVRRTPWQAELLEQQRRFRKRAARRFPDVTRWIWTDRSLAQASDWWTASFKASLFPTDVEVYDACCGAGADLVAVANRGAALGIDSDPVMQLLAETNARAHGLETPVLCQHLPSRSLKLPHWLHIDPDRRVNDLRTLEAEKFSPALDSVRQLCQQVRGAMIKLAPATLLDDEAHRWIENSTERIWVGNRSECRQQLVLAGELSAAKGSRSAVLCEPDVRDQQMFSCLRYSGQPNDSEQLASRLGDFIYDLHAVLHASGLHQQWAQENGLQAVGGSAGFYTGRDRVDSQWAQCFELIDELAWDDRKVRRWLRQREVGSVEVKNRLHRMDANHFQRRYSALCQGGESITLLVTRRGKSVRALVGRRLPTIAAA